jgi:mono/diheme cytochrome c family protein
MKRALTLGFLATALLAAACVTLDDYRNQDGTLDGARLYQRRCSACHEPFEPTDYGPHEWPDLVERYGPRAGLNPEARAAVVTFLKHSGSH